MNLDCALGRLEDQDEDIHGAQQAAGALEVKVESSDAFD